jgi:2,3-bisphosphoglycerate-independent phosphoglycerate mutase
VDTNLLGKAEMACSLLKEYDFILVHINGTDEASHRYDYRQKIEFIERIDRELVGYIHNHLNHMDEEIRLLICTDHATSPISGKHAAVPVPYIYWNSKQRDNGLKQGMGTTEVIRYLLSYQVMVLTSGVNKDRSVSGMKAGIR